MYRFCVYCGNRVRPERNQGTCRRSCQEKLDGFVKNWVLPKAEGEISSSHASRGRGPNDGGMGEGWHHTDTSNKTIRQDVYKVLSTVPIHDPAHSLKQIGLARAQALIIGLVAHCRRNEFPQLWKDFRTADVARRREQARAVPDDQAGERIADTVDAAAKLARSPAIAQHLREYAQALRDGTAE